MKLILTIWALSMAAFSANASVTCSQGDYRIDVNGESATYYYTSVKIAEVNNVQTTTDAAGVTYTTDMGFRLDVIGDQGVFQGLWPEPSALYSPANQLLLKCK